MIARHTGFASSLLIAVISITAASFTATSARAQEPAPQRLRGTIESLDGMNLKIKPPSGAPVSLHLLEGTRVVAAVPATLADIKPGSYVGIANEVSADGKQTAIEVHIFPEAMRGTGDGQRAWDLTKTSKMTNGTAGIKVTGVEGDKLDITYKGGTSTILIAPTTQIMAYTPGSMSDLKPGAHIFVREVKPAPDGGFQTNYILAGKDGFAPAL